MIFPQHNYGMTLPWADTKKWEKGKWYPMPRRWDDLNREDPDIYDGWDIFQTDPKAPDWDPLCIALVEDFAELPPLTFPAALTLCERHNGAYLIPLVDPDA
jgi:hypothetical protein